MKKDIKIYGLQKLSMVDYPEKIAATVFTGGCNLRCPFCHNALLVTRLSETPILDTDDVLQFLHKRKGLLDGVVISGGEPLLQKGIIEFMQIVKEMGFSVKLDTNGCYPEILASVLDKHLADYIAVDIKNVPNKYAQTTGLRSFDITPIEESHMLLKERSVDYEFRTTVVREFHSIEDIFEIGVWLQGAPRYFLQNFEDSGNIIASGLHGFSQTEMKAMAEAVSGFFGSVKIRGF